MSRNLIAVLWLTENKVDNAVRYQVDAAELTAYFFSFPRKNDSIEKRWYIE